MSPIIMTGFLSGFLDSSKSCMYEDCTALSTKAVKKQPPGVVYPRIDVSPCAYSYTYYGPCQHSIVRLLEIVKTAYNGFMQHIT